ncbi:MAG: hypothetical protein IPO92_16555 [Saprospiraceae bacterium]|nr:hypothetical protein [Saprospiraceae bacterium]
MNIKSFLFLIICCFCLLTVRANNIAITNVSIEGKNTTDNFQLVQFDLTWDNSWHINGGPQKLGCRMGICQVSPKD